MACTNPSKRRRLQPEATAACASTSRHPKEEVVFAASELELQEAIAASLSSSAVITTDQFFLYCKGLVVDDKEEEAKLGAIGVSIFDSKDTKVFEVAKPLVLPEVEMTDQVAELEALVKGLEFALSLDICNVMFSNIDSLCPYLFGNQKPKEAKVAALADRAVLLRKRFTNCHPFEATGKNAQLVLELARSSISNQAGKPFKKIIHMKKEECLICFEKVRSKKMFEIGGCRHRFCSSCIQKLVELKVDGREVPRCPQPGCEMELTTNCCKDFLPRKMYDLLNHLVKESSIPAPEKVYCPNPECSNLMSKTVALANNESLGSEEVTARRCLKCRTLFCVNCKALWHSGMSCDGYKEKVLGDANLNELAQIKRWKQCPKCFHMVGRISGCNRIRCRCETVFCYSCGREYKNRRASCSCGP